MGAIAVPKLIQTGVDSLRQLDKIANGLGISRALVVIDPNLMKEPINLFETVQNILDTGDIRCKAFYDFLGEPTTNHIDAALGVRHEFAYDGLIAIGGGTSIDIAKAVALFAANPTLSWFDIPRNISLKRLPLIAIPTTAGTGSEVTKVMVVTDAKTNVKMNPGHPDLVPDAALLDPRLTTSLPRNVTVFTGLDALTHAIEAYVSRLAQPVTDAFALDAIRAIHKNLPIVYHSPNNLEAREQMQIASLFAGLAFSNSSTNLAHAMGRPLGTRFHIPHGLSVAVTLPFVIRYGLQSAPERYATIARCLGSTEEAGPSALAAQCLTKIEEMWDKFGVWTEARKYMHPDELSTGVATLTGDAMSGNGIESNLRIPTSNDVHQLFEEVTVKLQSA